MKKLISYSLFRPFESRDEDVIGIKFQYNKDVIQIIKTVLNKYRNPEAGIIDRTRNIQHPGGWLSKQRCWFCEQAIWPELARELKKAGFNVIFKK